ncbi:PilW family protein [Neoaquamicrobium sediminum]|uniref:PilW family protein n=1 Tax=Neoaquamicrobium sediminum TaxID=1849104 RepID=UPI001563AEF5|nr:prepilin-type N-terminal cleavage/methylation domain-containing protein [Mesorhizobium sediminum]
MKRARRGFTLIEVMAAFVIALVLIVPVASIISGISGSFGGFSVRSKGAPVCNLLPQRRWRSTRCGQETSRWAISGSRCVHA